MEKKPNELYWKKSTNLEVSYLKQLMQILDLQQDEKKHIDKVQTGNIINKTGVIITSHTNIKICLSIPLTALCQYIWQGLKWKTS